MYVICFGKLLADFDICNPPMGYKPNQMHTCMHLFFGNQRRDRQTRKPFGMLVATRGIV